MVKRVAVTGASGYIGAHVASELTRHPEMFSVVGADIRPPEGQTCRYVPFDLLQEADDERLYEKLGSPDICIHLAWRDGFRHNAMSHLNDLPRHFAFLRNLADHGTRQFAVAGSFREYGKVNGKVDHCAAVAPNNLYSLAKTTLKTALEIYFAGKDICLQWLRPFTVYGDDIHNDSIMAKILRWEQEGQKTFPFTDGKEQYDYVHVDVLAKQIVAIIAQTEVSGIIDCCSGRPTSLGERIEAFLKENRLQIRPIYGAFPTRSYDSAVIYGDREALDRILQNCELYRGEQL